MYDDRLSAGHRGPCSMSRTAPVRTSVEISRVRVLGSCDLNLDQGRRGPCEHTNILLIDHPSLLLTIDNCCGVSNVAVTEITAAANTVQSRLH